jgi:hypothetical protein
MAFQILGRSVGGLSFYFSAQFGAHRLEAASKRQVLQWKLFVESERKPTFGTSVLIARPGPLATTLKSGWN